MRLDQFAERVAVSGLRLCDQVCGRHCCFTFLMGRVALLHVMQTPAEGRTGRSHRAQFRIVAVPTSASATTDEHEETDMGRIIISENISLDGVIEDPTGDEGSASGGWFNEIGQDTRDAWGKI